MRHYLLLGLVMLLSFIVTAGSEPSYAQQETEYRFFWRVENESGFVPNIHILACSAGECRSENGLPLEFDLQAFDISPDGKFIAGVGYRDERDEVLKEILFLSFEGDVLAQYRWDWMLGQWVTFLDWSPDGEWLALGGMGEICFVNVAQMVQEGEVTCFLVMEQAFAPHWSPTGEFLAISHSDEGQDYTGGERKPFPGVHNAISLINVEMMLEGFNPAVQITSHLQGECFEATWVSDHELLYRCEGGGVPENYPDTPNPPAWYVTDLDTGETLYVMDVLYSHECAIELRGLNRVAFARPGQISIWDREDNTVEDFVIPEDLTIGNCQAEWIPG